MKCLLPSDDNITIVFCSRVKSVFSNGNSIPTDGQQICYHLEVHVSANRVST